MSLNHNLKSRIRFITFPIRFLVGLVIVADALARPLYRPLLDWIASWRIMETFEAFVARLPRLAILVMFAIPFAVAEPLKVIALLLMAGGNLVVGLPLLIFSYLVTFLLVERIYQAGKGKLLTYPWFAWVMGYVGQIKERLVEYKKSVIETIRGVGAYIGL